MHDFTPWTSLAGGILIGLGTVLLLLIKGRVAGVSGILASALLGSPGDRAWRWMFLLGLMLGAGLWALSGSADVPVRRGFPAGVLAVAGVLVGFGTSMSRGCTSGHGVCGLARGSLRGWVGTLTFMAFGVLTTYVSRHLVGGL